jgi:hypothetical protein
VRKVGGLVGAGLVGALVGLALIRSASVAPIESGPAERARPPGSSGTAVRARAPKVDVVGDSLVTQSAAELSDRLTAAGLDATVVHRPRQDLGSLFVREQLSEVRSGPPADVLVVATAANDALRHRDRTVAAGEAAASDAFREQLDRSLAPFADRCVVVVNAREDVSPLYHPANARMLNALLRQAWSRYPNIVVADWAARSRSVPGEAFAPDQLHFGPDPNAPSIGSGSARAYAGLIVESILECPAARS